MDGVVLTTCPPWGSTPPLPPALTDPFVWNHSKPGGFWPGAPKCFIWLNFKSPMPVIDFAQSLAVAHLARFRAGCPADRKLEVGLEVGLLAAGTVRIHGCAGGEGSSRR